MIPKCKAWIKEVKEMRTVECLYFDEKNKVAQIFVHPKKDDPEDFALAYFPKQVELMQSTGLFDDRRKEIYEGDIVLWAIYELGNDDGSFEGKLIVDQNPYHLTRLYDSNSLEVIGNIYENPELKKGGNL